MKTTHAHLSIFINKTLGLAFLAAFSCHPSRAAPPKAGGLLHRPSIIKRTAVPSEIFNLNQGSSTKACYYRQGQMFCPANLSLPAGSAPPPPLQFYYVDGEVRSANHVQEAVLTRSEFFSIYGKTLGLSPNSQAVEINRVREPPKKSSPPGYSGFVSPTVVWSYNEQQYQGFPVLGSGYTLRLVDGFVDSANGRLVIGLNLNQQTNAHTITQSEAIGIAQQIATGGSTGNPSQAGGSTISTAAHPPLIGNAGIAHSGEITAPAPGPVTLKARSTAVVSSEPSPAPPPAPGSPVGNGGGRVERVGTPNNPTLQSTAPSARLAISTLRHSMHAQDAALVWEVTLPSETIELNARTGKLWNRLSRICSNTTPGNLIAKGNGYYPTGTDPNHLSNQMHFVAYLTPLGDYTLQVSKQAADSPPAQLYANWFPPDLTFGVDIMVCDARKPNHQKGYPFSSCPVSLDSSAGFTSHPSYLFTNPVPSNDFELWPDAPGVSILAGFEHYFLYLQRNFTTSNGKAWLGTDGTGDTQITASYDDQDSQLTDQKAKLNAFSAGDGAFFFGIDKYSNQPLVDLDVVGHEATHDLVRNTVKLENLGESGAMNEAMADIFGVLARRTALGQADPSKNWAVGVDTTHPRGLRSMDCPHCLQQPDYYNGLYYQRLPSVLIECGYDNDRCGTHINSTVMSHWFFLLQQKVGVEKAQKILFEVLRSHFIARTSGFADMRLATLKTADILFPGQSPSTKDAVAKCWNAVGVGDLNRTYEPAWGTTRVEPWPVSLSWSVGPDEVDKVSCYDVQLATDPLFLSALINETVCKGDPLGSPDVATDGHVFQVNPSHRATLTDSRFNLKAQTAYYWRVRPVSSHSHAAMQDSGTAPANNPTMSMASGPLQSHFPGGPSPSTAAVSTPDPAPQTPWGDVQTMTTADEKISLSIANGTELDPANLNLAWSTNSSAVSYEIQITKALDPAGVPDFNASIFDQKLANDPGIVPTTTLKQIQLTPEDKPFYWRVQAIGPDGLIGAWSDTEHFTMDLSQLKPKLISPANGQKFTDGTLPKYQWSAVDGARKYNSFYQQPGTQQWTGPFASILPWTNAQLVVAGGETTCWRVQPLFGDDFAPGAYSDTWCYSSSGTLPLLGPPDGTRFKVGQSIVFTWEPFPNAISYEIQFMDAKTLALSSGTAQWTDSQTTLDLSGKYSTAAQTQSGATCWRVIAMISEGRGATSDPWCYSVGIPTITSPAPGEQIPYSGSPAGYFANVQWTGSTPSSWALYTAHDPSAATAGMWAGSSGGFFFPYSSSPQNLLMGGPGASGSAVIQVASIDENHNLVEISDPVTVNFAPAPKPAPKPTPNPTPAPKPAPKTPITCAPVNPDSEVVISFTNELYPSGPSFVIAAGTAPNISWNPIPGAVSYDTDVYVFIPGPNEVGANVLSIFGPSTSATLTGFPYTSGQCYLVYITAKNACGVIVNPNPHAPYGGNNNIWCFLNTAQ